MNLTIPPQGIEEVRRLWAGPGRLWQVAAAAHDDAGLSWSPEAIRRRAARVIVEQIRGHVAAWPASRREWLDAIPATSHRQRDVLDVPGAGVDWVRTRLTGWPPREYHHRRRSRVADTVLIKVARWTIEALATVAEESDRLDPTFFDPQRPRLVAALEALDSDPLASASGERPSRGDLAAMKSSGRPWTSVGAVAQWLRTLEADPSQVGRAALDPDPALADRLFHVAVLGVVARHLREAGHPLHVVSLPGSPVARPILKVEIDGATWDLWFEMAGAWSHYDVAAPYSAAASGISGTGGPLGADLALLCPGHSAVLIECKYSADPTYVGRGGYEQTLAYMAEALTGLVATVHGIVVGPTELVTATGSTTTAVGGVCITNPERVGDLIVDLISADAQSLIS